MNATWRPLYRLILSGVLVLGACGDDGDDGEPHGRMDGGMDASVDGGLDAGDAGGDMGMDGGIVDAAADGAPPGQDGGPPPDGAIAETPRLIEIIATEFDFNPSRIYGSPGETVIFSIRNEGSAPHSFDLEIAGQEYALPSPVLPQNTQSLMVTLPDQAGDFVFYCPIGNHRSLGMEGALSVAPPTAVRLEPVASGLVSPIGMAVAPDESGRRFVVDQIGLVRIVTATGQLLEQPFLDVRDKMVALEEEYDERGLLGLAFHPDYPENGRFYVHYSAPLRQTAPEGWDHTTHISEFQVSGEDPNRAAPTSERLLLAVDQPQSNHNGGTLAFGPEDGFLYISLGDGGGAADNDMGHTPDLGNGQDLSKLLGKILRIDVDAAPQAGAAYAIPADNPFVADAEAADEIFAYGLRNPYRFSFDLGGDKLLYVGDAGQHLWEEVSLVRAGENYGWRRLEGTHCFNVEEPENPPATCGNEGPRGEPLRWPVIEFPNSHQTGGLGLTVVGGYVYRGDALPALRGQYVFGSLSVKHEQPQALLMMASDADEGDDLWPIQMLDPRPGQGDSRPFVNAYLKGFGQDAAGELYLLVSDEMGPTGTTGRVLMMRAVTP